MMQSCASAAKLRAASPFYISAWRPCAKSGPRHLGSSIRHLGRKTGARRMVLSSMLVRVKLFQDAGRKTTPSSGSPVVTKRQSAMTSLRASATIMILHVPIRLSAVRARPNGRTH